MTSKHLLALLTSALLGVAGCGGAGNLAGSTTRVSTQAAVEIKAITTLTSSVIPPGQPIRGDGDADNPADRDGNGDIDGSEDHDDDSPTLESYRFPDTDDQVTLTYGHPANAADRRALTDVARRYYAVAALADGATACSMLAPTVARSVAEDYGGKAGPAYLRGSKTCQAVMSMLFNHSHKQLAAAIKLLAVGVEGKSAQVVIGSRSMPASLLLLRRQDGRWKLISLLGQALP